MSDIHVVLTPFVSQIRIYDEPDGYEKRIPYKGIMTVTFMTDKIVYISGAHGKFETREAYEKIFEVLKANGVEELFYERRGKMTSRKL